MSTPTIAEITSFLAVNAHGSTVRASKVLSRSQSQVSANIASLEKKLGYALFIRENSRLRPSPHATTFLPLAERLIEAHQAIVSASRTGRNAKPFSIGAPRSLSMTFLPKVASAMNQRRGDLSIRMIFESYQEILDDVALGRLDVGIAKLPILDKRVVAQPLCEVPSVVVLPHNDPLTKREFIGPVEIANRPLIRLGTGSDFRERIMLAFKEQRVHPNFVYDIGGVGPACRLVAEGLGVAIVNKLMATEYLDLLNLKAIPFSPTVNHRFVWIMSPFCENPALAQEFGELCEGLLAEDA
ncbi:HTH-type transcriptional activator CmpR (plasmid) [Maritalea myrionectae]|uniref:HTH-type transcriptional activator CmpR n=1 Tax=Maritalea myrionectae TaxID=454601 RepID=A0A2R4MJB9_9HYPH|nr:LysR family transcriptional regulator [Maritalea myrionectae]AVX06060.1 HTH-type transcriptional activator CmpR [Maritalea myrionectae]